MYHTPSLLKIYFALIWDFVLPKTSFSEIIFETCNITQTHSWFFFKSIKKTTRRMSKTHSGVYLVDFEHVKQINILPLSLTLIFVPFEQILIVGNLVVKKQLCQKSS